MLQDRRERERQNQRRREQDERDHHEAHDEPRRRAPGDRRADEREGRECRLSAHR